MPVSDRIQEPPFAIQIELSEGCNLYCSFCGLQGIRERSEKNYKFATKETILSLANQIAAAGWSSRLELAMHGEPTMHPDYAEMVEVLRRALPRHQIMMTSNGGGFLKPPGPVDNIRSLFDAGLNILALDEYDYVKIVTKIRPHIEELRTFAEVREYPADPAGNPHQRGPISRRMITLMEDISKASKGTHSSLNNHAGAAFPRNDRMMGKRCAKPFRELSVRWDGNVACCCNDWRGEVKMGNIVTDGLETVWNSEPFRALRQHLYVGDRDIGACTGCDARSYRVGLLPDPSGKDTLTPPDEESRAAVARAMEGGPYTKPVLRPWEV